jgi:hypothetical protein
MRTEYISEKDLSDLPKIMGTKDVINWSISSSFAIKTLPDEQYLPAHEFFREPDLDHTLIPGPAFPTGVSFILQGISLHPVVMSKCPISELMRLGQGCLHLIVANIVIWQGSVQDCLSIYGIPGHNRHKFTQYPVISPVLSFSLRWTSYLSIRTRYIPNITAILSGDLIRPRGV